MSGDEHADERAGDDLRARLRAEDPAASLPPVESDRVRRLLEATMAHDARTARSAAGAGVPAATRRPRWPLAVAAAAVLVLGGVAGGLALTGDEPGSGAGAPGSAASAEPSTAPGRDGRTALALTVADPPPNVRCRRVTPEALAGMETAFAGTVTAVGGEAITFEVERWYAGGDVDVVEVLDPVGLGAALEGSPDFEPGQRFLVTAAEGQVTGCGFSAPYSVPRERMFQQAFS